MKVEDGSIVVVDTFAVAAADDSAVSACVWLALS